MKHLILFFLLLFYIYSATAQTDTLDFDSPLVDSLKQNIDFIKINYNSPDSIMLKDTMISVIVKFLVHPDGTFSDIEIESGFNDEIDKRAINCIRNLPPFQPTIIGKKSYYIRYAAQVIFSFKGND
ncbi:MAG: energy transducer TonB [Bacteroidota bacterium]